MALNCHHQFNDVNEHFQNRILCLFQIESELTFLLQFPPPTPLLPDPFTHGRLRLKELEGVQKAGKETDVDIGRRDVKWYSTQSASYQKKEMF